MVKVIFDNDNVYVSHDNGCYEVSPLTTQWLWLIGALENGEKVVVKDTRKTLQDHQHNMTFTLNE